MSLADAAAAINRHIQLGEQDAAVTKSRALRHEMPQHDRPCRLLVRSMLLDRMSEGEVAEALDALRSIASAAESSHVGLAHRLALHAVPTTLAASASQYFAEVYVAAGSSTIHQITSLALARGLAMLAEDARLRDRVEAAVSNSRSRTLFESWRLTNQGFVTEAFEILRDGPAAHPPAQSRRICELAKQLGRFDELLAFVESGHHGLGPLDQAMARFDCHWALGNRAAAEAALEVVPAELRLSSGLLTRIDLAHGTGAVRNEISRVTERRELDRDERAKVAAALLLTDDAPQAIAALAGTDATFAGRMTHARALYCERRFDEAEALLGRLVGTSLSAAAHKLQARILLERGQFSEAGTSRRTSPSVDGFDEVLFLALLGAGAYDEAFALHPTRHTFASLQAVFGERAERWPQDVVKSRFVIFEGGPGDELQTATLYSELARRADHTYITTDPRLLPLFARNFPQITFVGSHRRGPQEFATAGPGSVERAPNQFSALLTAEAHALAQSCDRVVFSKAVQRLSTEPGATLLPSAPHLRATSSSRPARHERFRVGLVWRSEVQSAWRRIHYLDADEIGSLLALDADFVCLQHDVTDDEKRLLATCGQNLSYPEVDLRDDFEATADAVKDLDIVVGVATTVAFLAASVGTEVLLLQPTRFGGWRSGPDDVPLGPDHWFSSATVATASPANDKTSLVAAVHSELARRIEMRNR